MVPIKCQQQQHNVLFDAPFDDLSLVLCLLFFLGPTTLLSQVSPSCFPVHQTAYPWHKIAAKERMTKSNKLFIQSPKMFEYPKRGCERGRRQGGRRGNFIWIFSALANYKLFQSTDWFEGVIWVGRGGQGGIVTLCFGGVICLGSATNNIWLMNWTQLRDTLMIYRDIHFLTRFSREWNIIQKSPSFAHVHLCSLVSAKIPSLWIDFFDTAG